MALLTLALPVLSLRTGMPSIKVVPPGDQSRQGYEQIQAGFGPGAPGALQIVGPASAAHQAEVAAQGDPGIAQSLPPWPGRGGLALIEAIPTNDPSSPQVGATIDRLRSELPSGALIPRPRAMTPSATAPLSC